MTTLRTWKRTQRQQQHLTAREQRLLAGYDQALQRDEWRPVVAGTTPHEGDHTMTTPDDPRLALAEAAGAIYPDLVADRISDEALTGDKQTRDRELDRLRKQYPSLFRSGSADGGAGRHAPAHPGRRDLNAFIRGRR